MTEWTDEQAMEFFRKHSPIVKFNHYYKYTFYFIANGLGEMV